VFFDDGTKAEFAGEAEGDECGGEAAWIREDVADDPLEHAAAEAAIFTEHDLGHLRANGFDEVVILDAGGAGGLAGAADEAAVEVFEDLVADADTAIDGAFHQVDAAARGVGFIEGFDIGGAGRETEAAMDAGAEFVVSFGREYRERHESFRK
jgi:hypothetical protein